MTNRLRSVRGGVPLVVAVLIAVVWVFSSICAAQTPTPQASPVAEMGANGGESGINPSYTDPGGVVESEAERSRAGLRAVMLVTLLIWLGLFAYVVRLDRRVRRLEE